jgi:type IV protein arginine methyltransferase
MAQQSIGTLYDASTRSQIAEIIAAASKHDNDAIQRLIDDSSFTECKAVDVQDPTTGYTPLHAAVASCRPQANGLLENGVHGNSEEDDATDTEVQKAHGTIKLLLENGAIWNQLDRNDETPACIAFRLGFDSLYQLMADAGIRAEMLLNRLDEYEELDDEEDDQPEEPVSAGGGPEVITEAEQGNEEEVKTTEIKDVDPIASNSKYLSSTLSMTGDSILDEQQNGVMMAWENDIMKKSADSLLQSPNRKFLNIGFGMGIIDSHVQNHPSTPAAHHIVEAHPEVLRDMRQKGWFNRPGVTVHEGRWQDVLPKLLEQGTTFDSVYYDTFAEPYRDFKDFFTEHLMGLLEQDGVWSYFNGMGADRQISYDVYQKIVEIDLFEAGFEVEWNEVALPDLGKEWDGVKRKYWNVQRYRLPVCKFME